MNIHDIIQSIRSNENLFATLNEVKTQFDEFSFLKFLNKKNELKYSVVHTAIFNRNVDLLEFLIDIGIDVDLKCHGTPPIHLIAMSSSYKPYANIWQSTFHNLLSKIDVTSRDDQGSSILHVLCDLNLPQYIEICSEILDRDTFNALLESKDRLQNRPIHKAVLSNSIECVQILLSKCASPLSQNYFGETPSHTAAKLKLTNIWKLLQSIKIVAEDNKVDRYGRLPSDICIEMAWNPEEHFDSPESRQNTSIIYHPYCANHLTCPSSDLESAGAPPENAKRLQVLIDEKCGILRSSPLTSNLKWTESTPAAIADILRVHEWSYIRKVHHTCGLAEEGGKENVEHLDGDTAISGLSFMAALHAAGAVCNGVDQVVKGVSRNVFCPVRPPGHHAGPRGIVYGEDSGPNSHGFCLLNNVSIAAAYAMNVHREIIKKVAIVDFDVHHGNGTEATVKYLRPQLEQSDVVNPLGFGTLYTPLFKPWYDETDSSNVLFASVHGYGARERELEHLMPRSAFYPGTGKTSLFDVSLLEPSSSASSAPNKGDGENSNGHKISTIKGQDDEMNGETNDNEPNVNDDHEDDDDDDDDDYNESVEHSQFEPKSAGRLVEVMKNMYSNNVFLTKRSNTDMASSLILDVGMELPDPYAEDAGLSYRYTWRNHFRDQIFPRLIKFNPDLVIISAGFDAHRKDTINSGYISLVEEDFEWVTTRLCQIANTCCKGRVVSALEGGYQVGGEYYSTLARSVRAHVGSLVAEAVSMEGYDESREAIDKEWEKLHVLETIQRKQSKIEKFASSVEHGLVVASSTIAPQSDDVDCTIGVTINSTYVQQTVQTEESTSAATKPKRKRNEVNYLSLDEELRKASYGAL